MSIDRRKFQEWAKDQRHEYRPDFNGLCKDCTMAGEFEMHREPSELERRYLESHHEHGPGCGHRKEYAPGYRHESEADDFRWVPEPTRPDPVSSS